MDKKVEQLSSGAYLIGFEESLLKEHYPVLYKSGGIVWVSIYANKTQQQPPIIEEVEPQQPIMEATQPQQPTVEAVPQPQAPANDDYFLFTPEYFAQLKRMVNICNFLVRNPRSTALHIAKALGVKQSTLSNTISTLIHVYKFIFNSTPGDGTHAHYSISENGFTKLKETK